MTVRLIYGRTSRFDDDAAVDQLERELAGLAPADGARPDMLDFFDFFLIGYVLAFILKDWQITYGQSAIILISAGLGAVPGAFFWAGWATASAAARCSS
jgi:hypothetical protein